MSEPFELKVPLGSIVRYRADEIRAAQGYANAKDIFRVAVVTNYKKTKDKLEYELDGIFHVTGDKLVAVVPETPLIREST